MRFLPIVAAVALTSPAVAQTPESGPAEGAARRLLAAFEQPGSLDRFIAGNYASTSLARESAEQRAAPLDALKQAAGGFRVVSATPQGDRMIEMIVASRRGDKHAKLVLFTSGNEPGKITNLFFLSARDPAKAAADNFPTRPVSEPEAVRLVQKRLAAMGKEDRFSGAFLLARRDKVLLKAATGLAEQSWKMPNRTSTRFHIASVGKMWTAVAVLRLAEQGKLSLDDSVARWVPTYPHPNAAKAMTLRMLLQHRAGVADWDGRALGKLSSAQAAATMTKAPGEPNKNFGYSNAGYVLLAAAAEAASGLSLEELMQREVFAPAGMTRSGMWPVTAIIPDRATGYLRPATDPLGFGARIANEQFLGAAADGSGGGYSTVGDMFAFHRALATGKLVKSETLRKVISEAGPFPGAPRPARYGLGLNLTDCAGVPTLGHGGGGQNSGVSSVTYASLDGEWTIIALSNYDPPAAEELALDVCELVHRR